MAVNWSDYPNFTKEEFKCSHTGLCEMDKDFMDRLQDLRTHLEQINPHRPDLFRMTINSGYRHKTHPIERKKQVPGEHTDGKAADIKAHGHLAHLLIKYGADYFPRIGVSQKGPHNKRFIHLGTSKNRPSPTVWSY